MGRFTSIFNGIANSFSSTKRVEAKAKYAKKNDMILRSSGTINVNNFAAVYSKRGEKGVNQDCCIVWEEFGCQEDMLFCGVFDGHGPWGHYVAKRVCETMPSSLLCNWQQKVVEATVDPNSGFESDKKLDRFTIWKNSFIKTCAEVDQDLQRSRKFDSFHSGTTGLAIIKQGELLVVANVGDSRAVMATMSDHDYLIPVQLTVDFKPNLPNEAARIVGSKGRVFCMDDEPGVHRVWLPNEESPGLAMSRAFGDFCVKSFGLISVPGVTQRSITSKDQFIVLASDGVWDVVSNEEAVEIISSTVDKSKSAKRLVECATRAWRRKRKNIATDDMSAVCLFFNHDTHSSQKVHLVTTSN
ncbi:probable protein phosphatase 2C 73 [Rutidosis leptorrhynchoides]|uniref:probable protein phosphatase 2C 73 n=1 Tax=Rutidosis leptorrhynchoides TaxID=125765 RepID=UPI003A98E70D